MWSRPAQWARSCSTWPTRQTSSRAAYRHCHTRRTYFYTASIMDGWTETKWYRPREKEFSVGQFSVKRAGGNRDPRQAECLALEVDMGEILGAVEGRWQVTAGEAKVQTDRMRGRIATALLCGSVCSISVVINCNLWTTFMKVFKTINVWFT